MMINKEPKVAVLIASYNHENFIISCLESVLNQSYSNLDVYIADDCSIDNTVQVVTDYLKNNSLDNKVVVISNEFNKGIAGNYNSLITQALKDTQVEYIIPFAGDDLMRVDKVALQVEALRSQPDVCLCYSNMQWFNSGTGKKIINHFNFIFKPEFSIESIISEAVIPTPTLCIKRKAVEVVRYSSELRYINDYLFAVELAIIGRGVVYVPECLVFYRKHGASIMDTKTFPDERKLAANIINNRYGYKKSTNRFSKTAVYDEILNCLHNDQGVFLKVIVALPLFFSSRKWFFRLLKLIFIIKSRAFSSFFK